MKKLSFLLILVLCLVTTVDHVKAQVADQIYIGKGPPVRGVITKMTATEVTVTINALARPFPVNEIVRVSLADSPSGLQEALSQIRNGQIESAQTALNKLDLKAIKNKYVTQEVLFCRALCAFQMAQQGQADIKQAGGMLKSFVTDHKDSYHYFEAQQMFGDLAVTFGNYPLAAESYGEIRKAPWPEYKARGAVLQATAQLGAEQYPQALTSFEVVLKERPSTPQGQLQFTLAQVGKARCLAETGSVAEGIQLVRDVLKNNDPKEHPELFGRAYNTLGACYRKDKKSQDALLAYLHTDLLFYREPQVHAEALYYLSRLWADVKKTDRANRARSLLRERYASSVWATKQ